MKAIRIIVIALVLMAAGCRSSADEATQISSTAAATSDLSERAAEPAVDRDESPAQGEASQLDNEDHAEANPVDPATDDGGERATDDAGSGLGTDFVATGLLARVSDATVEASTGRFEGRFAAEAAPGAEPGGSFEMTVEGSYDLDAEAFDISVDLSGLVELAAADASPAEADMFASMFDEPVHVRSAGGIAWVRWGLLAGMFGAVTDDGETAWIEAGADEAASMTGQFGVDSPESPTDLLQTLADLDAAVVEVGPEVVRGTDTTHYEIIIDLEAAAAGLPPAERAELEAQLPGGVNGELPIDLWIGVDGLLRRLVVEIDDFDGMGLGADAEGLGSLLIEFEIFDVGQAVAIEPPPVDQVITIDELGFSLDGDF